MCFWIFCFALGTLGRTEVTWKEEKRPFWEHVNNYFVQCLYFFMSLSFIHVSKMKLTFIVSKLFSLFQCSEIHNWKSVNGEKKKWDIFIPIVISVRLSCNVIWKWQTHKDKAIFKSSKPWNLIKDNVFVLKEVLESWRHMKRGEAVK